MNKPTTTPAPSASAELRALVAVALLDFYSRPYDFHSCYYLYYKPATDDEAGALALIPGTEEPGSEWFLATPQRAPHLIHRDDLAIWIRFAAASLPILKP